MQRGGLTVSLSDADRRRIASAKQGYQNVKSGIHSAATRVGSFAKDKFKKSSDFLKNIRSRTTEWNNDRHRKSVARDVGRDVGKKAAQEHLNLLRSASPLTGGRRRKSHRHSSKRRSHRRRSSKRSSHRRSRH